VCLFGRHGLDGAGNAEFRTPVVVSGDEAELSRTVKPMIPAPPIRLLQLGPLEVHLYALCILLGIWVAYRMTRTRLGALGYSTATLADLTLVSTFVGLIGARIYHVATAWDRYQESPASAFAIWNGGLGIWGAIPAGIGAIVITNRFLRRSAAEFIPTPALIAAAIPGVMVAQAIGRIGNWFNQELYGRATSLPWGLRVDGEVGTYHPVFAYEGIWLLIGALIVGRVEGSRRRLASYVAWYCAGRFVLELLRIDPSPALGGLRWNAWVSMLCAVVALTYLSLTSASRKTKIAGVVIIATACVDQFTKSLALEHLSSRPISVLGESLRLQLVTNAGAAFSFAAGSTLVLTLIAISVLTGCWFTRSRLLASTPPMAVGLFIGGLSGNLLDRCLRSPYSFEGEVVDFLAVGSFPVFNIADVALCLSLVVVALGTRRSSSASL